MKQSPLIIIFSKKALSKNKNITLANGGQVIEEKEISKLKSKFSKYQIGNANLEIQQGFVYLNDNKENKQTTQLSLILSEKENQLQLLQVKLDSLISQEKANNQVYTEFTILYPDVISFILKQATDYAEDGQHNIWIALINSKSKWDKKEKSKIENWLKVRLNSTKIKIYYE